MFHRRMSRKSSQLDIVEKIAETPEIQMIHGTQTPESSSTPPVRQVAQSEVVEAIEIGVKTIDLEWAQVHPAGLVQPDDTDAQIKFLTAEALHGVHGNRLANELGRRVCDGRDVEERLCDGRDVEEETSIPSRSEQGGF